VEEEGKCHIPEKKENFALPKQSDITSKQAISSESCTGAVRFMQSLLEPDPAKRPGVEEAIKDKWLNEGFTGKILSATTYENR